MTMHHSAAHSPVSVLVRLYAYRHGCSAALCFRPPPTRT